MPMRTNRRRFLQTSAAVGMGVWVAGGLRAQESQSPNEKVNFACIGIGGKGSSDSGDAANHGNIVAICDADKSRLEAAKKRFEETQKKEVKAYTDYRKLLEENANAIDAVTVSTPDHTHAPAALQAMRMGKHCFCQKPLTHAIYEARLMGQVAREKKVVTQMGNQGTAESGLRKAAALLRKGALGNVTEVHVWTNRPIWPQGQDRPQPEDPPATLDWQSWLGPAPERPYARGYHPFAWRGWWDFGTGALGDMACHTLNMPYAGLDLRDPVSVQAQTSGHNKDSYPKWSIITFEFPANDWRPALKLFWYDGGKRPDKELLNGENPSGSGCAVIGEKGKLYSPNDYAAEYRILTPGLEMPEVEFVQSPGHFTEWVNAIKGQGTPMSNFPDYAGPLTETILLGNLAVYAADKEGEGPKVEWDAKAMQATNMPELAKIVKPEYREGYKLD